MATVLVTGANRGIGLELCRQLKSRGDDVIGVCRNASPELRALGVRIVDGVDVADAEGVESLAAAVRGEAIDVLVNNAGMLRRDDLDHLDFGDITAQFEVNALGPLRVTRALLGNLHEGSKVAIVTSRMGSIGDNTSGGYYGYRASKAAVNMIGMSLRRDLEPLGVSVVLLHPGMVATDMTGGRGVSVQASAAGLIERIDALGMNCTGEFRHAEGDTLPW